MIEIHIIHTHIQISCLIRKLHGKICDDFESPATDRQAAKPNTAAFKQMTPPERYCAMRETQPESIKKKLIETTQAIPSGFYLHYKFRYPKYT